MKCIADELRFRGDFESLPWVEVLGEEFCRELLEEVKAIAVGPIKFRNPKSVSYVTP